VSVGRRGESKTGGEERQKKKAAAKPKRAHPNTNQQRRQKKTRQTPNFLRPRTERVFRPLAKTTGPRRWRCGFHPNVAKKEKKKKKKKKNKKTNEKAPTPAPVRDDSLPGTIWVRQGDSPRRRRPACDPTLHGMKQKKKKKRPKRHGIRAARKKKRLGRTCRPTKIRKEREEAAFLPSANRWWVTGERKPEGNNHHGDSKRHQKFLRPQKPGGLARAGPA